MHCIIYSVCCILFYSIAHSALSIPFTIFSWLPVYQLLCDKQVSRGGGPVLHRQQGGNFLLMKRWKWKNQISKLIHHQAVSHDELNASKLGYHVAHTMDLYDEVQPSSSWSSLSSWSSSLSGCDNCSTSSGSSTQEADHRVHWLYHLYLPGDLDGGDGVEPPGDLDGGDHWSVINLHLNSTSSSTSIVRCSKGMTERSLREIGSTGQVVLSHIFTGQVFFIFLLDRCFFHIF